MKTADTTTLDRPAVAPMDPRIRQRRVKVRRDEGRRRLRLIVTALSILGAVGLGWLTTRSPILDVDRVEVVGARHTPAALVVRASGVRVGRPMTGVREGRAGRRVDALPWVQRASVRRSWPGTVVVTVRERRAVAAVRAATGGWMLVDRAGRLLAAQALPERRLPAIEGIDPAAAPGATLPAKARDALRVAAAIPRREVARVPVVALVDGEVELRLAALSPKKPGAPSKAPPLSAAGPVVRFGAVERVEEKLLAVFTVLERVDLRGLVVLDVRVPSSPVITRNA